MCLIYDNKNIPFHGFVADKDITCYKVLQKNFYGEWASPVFKNTSWKEGQTVESPVFVEVGRKWYDCWWLFGWSKNPIWTKGFASTEDPNDYIHVIRKTCEPNPDLTSIGKGLYSFCNYMNEKMQETYYAIKTTGSFYKKGVAIARCVIPEHTHYYIDTDAQVFVSNKLRVEEIVDYSDVK